MKKPTPSPPISRLRDTAEARGRQVADFLRGAWHPSPPPPDLSEQELELLAPILFRNGSSGLAWNRIRKSPLKEAQAATLLRDGYRYHTMRVRALEKQAVEVLGLLESRGFKPILAKGWSLGRLYPEPGLRPYGDLDILVTPGRKLEAQETLAAPGTLEAPVELHTGFPLLRDRSRETLLDRSRSVTLSGVSLRILGPEDELRLACLHGLNHGLCRPLWLSDVALILENLPARFDWAYAMEGEPWLSEGVRCGLGLAQELLGASLSEAGVPDPWKDPPLPGWLVPAALAAFGAKRHYLELGDPGELMLKPGTLLEAARLRWANPIEATCRRFGPWDDSSRVPIQLSDYLSRGLGFVTRIPANLRFARELTRESGPPDPEDPPTNGGG